MKCSRSAFIASVVLATAVPFLLVPAAAHAHSEAAPGVAVTTVTAARTGAPIRLDGRLDDVAWKQAPAADGFLQRDPAEGEPASERTELRVAYDDDALYVGLRLFDRQPEQIVKRLSRRDATTDADSVALYLDPYFDHLTGTIFEVSAAGVQRDAVIFNDSWTDDSWDAVWQSAVSVDDSGWSAELRIPFSELRFNPSERLTWGINVSRTIHRRNETAWLELVPKTESGLASRMAHLTGLDGIQTRRHLAISPYAVAKAELVEPEPGDPFSDGSSFPMGFGLDLKYGLTSNLVLDATVNPDFGQVEVDPAVVNLSDFETFFQERRPFFIEGSQIFDNFGRNGANSFWGFSRSEPDLFYSRRIGRSPQGSTDAEYESRPSATTILGAAKVTGRTASGWSLGVLDAVTGREVAQLQDAGVRSHQEIEPLTNYFVARAQRELSRGGVGLMATAVGRELRDPELKQSLVGQAYVAGVDGYYFLDAKKDWAVTGRVAGSYVSGTPTAVEDVQRASQRYFQRPDAAHIRFDPEATSLSGWTGSLNLNRNGGSFRVNTALWATSPGFESNDIGFNWRSDRFGAHAAFTWRKTDPDRLTRSRAVSIAKWYAWNFGREAQGDGLYLFANAQLLNYWSVNTTFFWSRRVLDDRLTRGGPSVLSPAVKGGSLCLQSDSRKRLSLHVDQSYESDEAGSWDWSGFLGLELKPSSSLNFSVGPRLTRSGSVAQWVDTFEDVAATETFGSRYVFANLSRNELSMAIRANLVLSPTLSFQLYAQPLLSVGSYTGFKELAQPRSYDFLRYGEDTGTIEYDSSQDEYTVQPGGAGQADPFTFDNPDFNFKSLRVNAVVRWEYRPGSALYAVWTQERLNDDNPGHFEMGRDARDLLNAPSDNIFLVKFVYRFSR